MQLVFNRLNVKQLVIALSAILIAFNAQAQEAKESKKVVRPDIPGQFIVDWGFNGTIGSPAKFKKGWFGSRTFNFYYYYPLRIGKSKFTFVPGIGIGQDRFKFKNYYYLADTGKLDKHFALVPSYFDTNGDRKTDSLTFPGIKKSFLTMNYLDVPLEFRFNVNPDDLARTFWIGVGGRAGWMYSANSKIKQKTGGEKIVHKDRYNQGLNHFRYGLSLRMGVGNFNFFGFYNMSPLFQKDKGPSQTQMQVWTFGISLIGL